MRQPCSVFILLLAGVSAHAQTALPTSEGWRFDPSVYALGSLDASTDFPYGGPFQPFREPGTAADVGFGLDSSREDSRGWFKGSLLGLTRSPFSDYNRTFFGATRIEGSMAFGANARLTFTDEAKAQTRPHVDLGDYWGNLASLRAEWNRPSGGGVELEMDDRRRTLPDLRFLGFSEQEVDGGTFLAWGAKRRAHLGAGVQKYSATTAEGGRAVIQGELATFTRTGIATIRLAWFEPFGDRRRTPPPITGEQNEPGAQYDFGDIGRAEFFETLTLKSAYEAMSSLTFFDPLESESDEWDFGRHKFVAAGFGSRQLSARTTASAFLRYEYKQGPNLLLPSGAIGATPFTDNRVEARGSVSYSARAKVSLLLQTSYVQNWSTRPPLDFQRFLLAIGVQIHF